RRAHQRAIDGRDALHGWTSRTRRWIGCALGLPRLTQLRGQFGVAGLKESDERALREGSTHRLHFGKLAAAAEDLEELRRLFHAAAVHEDLVENDSPRHDGKQREDDENGLRNPARRGD